MVSGYGQGISHNFLKTRFYYLERVIRLMVIECNIDARGKALRLFGGLASIVGGLCIAGVAYLDIVELPYLWYASAGMLVGGSLGVFEGWSGWCVARAMGIWTPI